MITLTYQHAALIAGGIFWFGGVCGMLAIALGVAAGRGK